MAASARVMEAVEKTMQPQGFNFGANLGRVGGSRHRPAYSFSPRASMERRHKLYAHPGGYEVSVRVDSSDIQETQEKSLFEKMSYNFRFTIAD